MLQKKRWHRPRTSWGKKSEWNYSGCSTLYDRRGREREIANGLLKKGLLLPGVGEEVEGRKKYGNGISDLKDDKHDGEIWKSLTAACQEIYADLVKAAEASRLERERRAPSRRETAQKLPEHINSFDVEIEFEQWQDMNVVERADQYLFNHKFYGDEIQVINPEIAKQTASFTLHIDKTKTEQWQTEESIKSEIDRALKMYISSPYTLFVYKT